MAPRCLTLTRGAPHRSGCRASPRRRCAWGSGALSRRCARRRAISTRSATCTPAGASLVLGALRLPPEYSSHCTSSYCTSMTALHLSTPLPRARVRLRLLHPCYTRWYEHISNATCHLYSLCTLSARASGLPRRHVTPTWSSWWRRRPSRSTARRAASSCATAASSSHRRPSRPTVCRSARSCSPNPHRSPDH